MSETFNGWPADYFKFFRALKANNNREWFNDNKQRYRESVHEPLAEFVEAMAPRLNKISKHIVAETRQTQRLGEGDALGAPF